MRDAFLAKGHDAMSCDLLPTDVPGPHYQGDVTDILYQGWDMMIAHPPCTYLCSSGLHWNKRTPGRQALTEQALEFVRVLLDSGIPRIAVENPIGCIGTQIRPYNQKLQPWQFGHDASKGTCIWTDGLPLLNHTKIIPPKGWHLVTGTSNDFKKLKIDGVWFGADTLEAASKKPVWGNQTPSGQNKLGPSPDRWKERSKTYEGIAAAFAEQWG